MLSYPQWQEAQKNAGKVIWRLLKTGSLTAAQNMAIDEAIQLIYQSKVTPPTIRFYTWQPAAVSIGYFQKSDTEIDFAACQKAGIDVVRRLTGGRAVLHADELTYSIIVGEDYPEIPMTVTASYRYLSRGLLNGLLSLGVEAELTKPQASYARKTHTAASAACFDSPSHYELTVKHKKLIGSAQVRKQGIILQHGSILRTFSAKQMVSILKINADERLTMQEMLAQRVMDLDTAVGRRVQENDLMEALQIGFKEAMGIELAEGGLTSEEIALAEELLINKYQSESWTHKR